ncbi:translin-associated protein X [Plutella xylostella]|uniref:translin-associated protein X n=1 Tax=Plutella xylostella TaxID=51655 RepID=UPI0020326447|nr:translin-associated protein X [Plutella xylostella]
MSGRGGGRHRQRARGGRAAREGGPPGAGGPVDAAAAGPVLAQFRAAAAALNDRHDRHERLVKLSRDITIESKRIIFLLHSAISVEEQEKATMDAMDRLNALIAGPIKAIGIELEQKPAYLHARAVSPGFQEFCEAYTFCYLMKHKELPPWSKLQNDFTYQIKNIEVEEQPERTVVTMLTQSDFLLGLADLSGELMRRAINSISRGIASDNQECHSCCQTTRDLFTGFVGLFGASKEVSRKLCVTRANVGKVEAALYALALRPAGAGDAGAGGAGGAGTARLRDWAEPPALSDDEGFY